MNLHIDHDDGRPLYLQLAGHLTGAIEAGEYAPGDRLPTESELERLTGLSKGTIKAAYARLDDLGVVRRVRGSGVYVRDRAQEDHSPDLVMAALFDTLTHSHGMPVPEAHRMIQAQLDRAFAESDLVSVTLVDCNMETINASVAQLEQVPGMSLSTILFDELLFTGEAMISPQCELVITTQLHHPGVCRYTEHLGIQTEPYSLRENKETVAALSKLPEDQRVCVLYRSDAFLSSVRYTWRLLKKRGQMIPCQENDVDALDHHSLSGLPFLLPPDYLEHCSNQALQAVFRARSAGSVLIPIQYEIDKGSILHITQLVENIRAGKRGRFA